MTYHTWEHYSIPMETRDPPPMEVENPDYYATCPIEQPPSAEYIPCPYPEPTGWVCPKCGRVWAIWVRGCDVCNAGVSSTGDTSAPITGG